MPADSSRRLVEGAPAHEGAPVAEGLLRAEPLAQLPAALRGLGVDPELLLAGLGLTQETFTGPQGAIPIATLGLLLALAVRRTGCTHFGLLVGQRCGLESLGLVGLFARHSPDVGTALRNLTANLQLRDRGGVASLRIRGVSTSLGYAVYQPGVEATDQICDGAIALAMNAMRSLCGPGWRPSEVRFAHAIPSDPRPFRGFFGAPLRFDFEQTALVFSARWLAQRTRGADPVLYQTLGRRIAALRSREESDPVADLRRILRTMLVGGGGSVEEVAQRLGLHRRTLNRRLRARGTSVHEIVEQTRSEIARMLVEQTRMPMMEIASALGYADASAFTRAFRRWAGVAPSACRVWPRARAVTRTVKPDWSAAP